jgi:pimeloyl-ACP methyl ester carboxylesterase
MSMEAADFQVHRASVRGVEIAYLREGVGGFPLVLLHGWPETKRIWWRNVRPLADAGFEVIVLPEDHVIPRLFPRAAEVAFPERVGPFVVEDAGHFLQWEQAQALNQALRYFCLDLLGRSDAK